MRPPDGRNGAAAGVRSKYIPNLDDDQDDGPNRHPLQGLGEFRSTGEEIQQVVGRLMQQRLQAVLNAVRMARVHALDAAPWLWHQHGANFLEAAALQLLEAELELVVLIAGDPR